MISAEVKRECVRRSNCGEPARQIYENYFLQNHDSMSLRTFRRRLYDWKRVAAYADTELLDAGTFPAYAPHGATVQVNGKGEITQAWIKQTLDDGQFEKLLEVVKEKAEPLNVPRPTACGDRLLEIPLYDLHFPLSEHRETLSRVLEIINGRIWEDIVIIIGQDLFHNDDFRGRTASGRQIEKVDIPEGWRMARDFYTALIISAIKHSERTKIVYSKGNHDESLAWAFVQMLRATFPYLDIDDTSKQRKVISWRECFIGITHGAYGRAVPRDLRGQFTIEFPTEFASAKVREIHCGHLHSEAQSDIYGVMIRRLSKGGETDEWSNDEGYVGAHKRYTVYEWVPGALRAIYYV